MLPKKTVLVVGAGASSEFGLPLGSTLPNLISRILNFRQVSSKLLENGDNFVAHTLSSLSTSRGIELNSYVKQCRNLRNGIVGFNSIDDYLNSHSNNKDLVEIGKIAICQAILLSERDTKIYYGTQNGIEFFNESIKKSWLSVFTKLLNQNIKKENIDSIFENIVIICFNYDRCIEHVLFLLIQISYNITEAEAAQCMSKLTIIHPYGTVGKLPWQDGGLKIPFGHHEQHNLETIAKGISLYTEQKEDPDFNNIIDKYMGSAEKIMFLGFGFHKQNIDLIARLSRNRLQIRGTAKGESPANKTQIRSTLFDKFITIFESLDTVQLEDKTCAEMVASHSRFLTDI